MQLFSNKSVVDHFLNLGWKLDATCDYLLQGAEKYVVEKTLSPKISAAFYDFINGIKSPFTAELPLMNPFHVGVISLVYLLVIFLGIQILKLRGPINVKYFAMFHNLFLGSLSFYMGCNILKEAHEQGYSLFGNAVDKSENGLKMAKFMWLFYFSKIFEFIDTMIMMLKKNNRQISFLHLYHHTSIFSVWWLVTLMAPGFYLSFFTLSGGEAYFSAAFNSFIHVVMYGYYLLSSLGVKQVSFVKKYITMMQMTQFVCMLLQSMYNIKNDWKSSVAASGKDTYPLGLSIILFFYMQTMLALFANFFIKDRQRVKADSKKSALKKKKI